MVTLVKVIHNCVMSAILLLRVWDFKCLYRFLAFLSICFLQILKIVDQDSRVYITALLLLDLPAPTVISIFPLTHLKYISYKCHVVMVNSFVHEGDIACSLLHKETKYIQIINHL